MSESIHTFLRKLVFIISEFNKTAINSFLWNKLCLVNLYCPKISSLVWWDLNHMFKNKLNINEIFNCDGLLCHSDHLDLLYLLVKTSKIIDKSYRYKKSKNQYFWSFKNPPSSQLFTNNVNLVYLLYKIIYTKRNFIVIIVVMVLTDILLFLR